MGRSHSHRTKERAREQSSAVTVRGRGKKRRLVPWTEPRERTLFEATADTEKEKTQ